MKFNKLWGILLVICMLIVCLNTVSAADNSTSMVETDNGNLAVENDVVFDALEVSSDSDVIGAGNKWYVKAGAPLGGDGSEDKPYANIKAVTNNANYKENDIIYLMGGNTYKGPSNLGISLKENTTIIAYGNDNPIIDAQNSQSIFKISNSGITIKGLTFIHGGGTVDAALNKWTGGAIYNTGDNLTVDNCTFKDPDTLTYGAGIFSNGKNTEIKNSYFTNNDASYGGAIAINGPNAKIINNEFRQNSGVYGGAINIYDYGGALIENNTFVRNDANMGKNGYAGAIYARAGNNVIKNNKFDYNTAGSYGGAICLVNPGNVVDNCTFTNNQIFKDSTSSNWGGAIYTQSPNNITNSYFFNNAVRDNGGAIYVRGSDNLVENCTFEKNWAARGGAIYVAPMVGGNNITNPMINNCTFNENGVDQSKGGAIFSWALNTSVTNSKFNNNKAMAGGAILYQRGSNFLENDTFIRNVANRYGGGAIASARFGDTINNCTFKDNSAQGYGGAVSADYPTITDSQFINNDAYHGGAIFTIAANVSDSEFKDNTAADDWIILAATKLTESNNDRQNQEVISLNNEIYRYIDFDYDTERPIVPGYYAYCVEEFAEVPEYGVLWDDLRFAQNSETEEYIGEYLKILIFKYCVSEDLADSFQEEINIFSDHDFRNSNNAHVQEVVRLYDSGFRVPSVNAIKICDDGTIAVYNFKEIVTPSATQNVFAFNITYGPNLTVEKEVVTNPIFVNKEVDFNITVKNTGKCNLTSVWINETDFSKELVYKSFNSKYNWTYDSDNKLWILNDVLEVNKTAYIILTFKVTDSGNMTNNVSVGVGNYSFANDTVNFTVFAPDMKVEKITLTPVVKVGTLTSFKIVVTNTGDCKLGDIFVYENNYDGLVYERYEGEDWVKEGNMFKFNGVLNPGENASFIIFFKTIKEGNFTNIVIAGSNSTDNKTTNNTTTVIKNETPKNETPANKTNITKQTNKTIPKEDVKANLERATGNPLFALLAVLLICVSRVRKFKK